MKSHDSKLIGRWPELECDFDFVSHNLSFTTSDGQVRVLALVPRTVADFRAEVFFILDALGMPVNITDLPCEIPEPIPFSRDTRHHSYDPEYVTRFWTVVSGMDTVFKDFRAFFRGKCSPVHFFWVRRSADPERTILDFAESTYEAGAKLGGWDRASLEYPKAKFTRRDYARGEALRSRHSGAR